MLQISLQRLMESMKGRRNLTRCSSVSRVCREREIQHWKASVSSILWGKTGSTDGISVPAGEKTGSGKTNNKTGH